MCNSCKCENSEKCSIVGNIPLGFCCERCDYYVDGKTCARLQMNVDIKIPPGLKSFAEKKRLLSTGFCLKQTESITDGE